MLLFLLNSLVRCQITFRHTLFHYSSAVTEALANVEHITCFIIIIYCTHITEVLQLAVLTLLKIIRFNLS